MLSFINRNTKNFRNPYWLLFLFYQNIGLYYKEPRQTRGNFNSLLVISTFEFGTFDELFLSHKLFTYNIELSYVQNMFLKIKSYVPNLHNFFFLEDLLNVYKHL